MIKVVLVPSVSNYFHTNGRAGWIGQGEAVKRIENIILTKLCLYIAAALDKGVSIILRHPPREERERERHSRLDAGTLKLSVVCKI